MSVQHFRHIHIHVHPESCCHGNSDHYKGYQQEALLADVNDMKRMAMAFAALLERRLEEHDVIGSTHVSLTLHDIHLLAHNRVIESTDSGTLIPVWDCPTTFTTLLAFNWISTRSAARFEPHVALQLPSIAWIDNTNSSMSSNRSQFLRDELRAAWLDAVEPTRPFSSLPGGTLRHWIRHFRSMSIEHRMVSLPSPSRPLEKGADTVGAGWVTERVCNPFGYSQMSIQHVIERSLLADGRRRPATQQDGWLFDILATNFEKETNLTKRLLHAAMHDLDHYVQPLQRQRNNLTIVKAATHAFEAMRMSLGSSRFEAVKKPAVNVRKQALVRKVNKILQPCVDIGIMGQAELMEDYEDVIPTAAFRLENWMFLKGKEQKLAGGDRWEKMVKKDYRIDQMFLHISADWE